jgi:hypothetical protein
MSVRLTKAAWLLLQRLNQETAQLAFCPDRRCGRYHFVLRGKLCDIVRDSTIGSLRAAGLLRAAATVQPVYSINDKARHMLKERMTDAEFMEEVKA